MAGTTIDPEGLPWETWDDSELAARSPLRWKLIFSGRRTPTEALSTGLAEFPPGAVLPLHHHAPAEVYHGLDGEGLVEVEGEPLRLRAGVSLLASSGRRACPWASSRPRPTRSRPAARSSRRTSPGRSASSSPPS